MVIPPWVVYGWLFILTPGTCVRNSDPEALAVVLEFDEGGQQVFFKKPEIRE